MKPALILSCLAALATGALASAAAAQSEPGLEAIATLGRVGIARDRHLLLVEHERERVL